MIKENLIGCTKRCANAFEVEVEIEESVGLVQLLPSQAEALRSKRRSAIDEHRPRKRVDDASWIHLRHVLPALNLLMDYSAQLPRSSFH